MKIKKFPQSHLLITKGNSRLVIDPGNITFAKGYQAKEFQGANGYLITHSHGDHLDLENIKQVVGGGTVYGNFDVAEKLKGLGIQVVVIKDREKFKVGEFEIEARELLHFRLPNKVETPLNTGFVIDGILFHAGDGFEYHDLKVENVALPYGHPSLSTTGVLEFAEDLGAKLLIPIHYDSYQRDPEELKRYSEFFGLEVRVLDSGQETEV